MAIKKWVEVICDWCNTNDYFGGSGNTTEAARSFDWIITNDKKAFCSKDCLKAYRKSK